MNYQELVDKQVELPESRTHRAYVASRNPRSEGELNQQRDLFLNDSLRSTGSSIQDDQSISSASDADASLEEEGLLENRHYPSPDIAGLYRVLYDYLRFSLAAFFFLFSFYLLFGAHGECYNASGALKKLPKVSRVKSLRVRHVRNEPHGPAGHLQRSADPLARPPQTLGAAEPAPSQTHAPAPGHPRRLDRLRHQQR